MKISDSCRFLITILPPEEGIESSSRGRERRGSRYVDSRGRINGIAGNRRILSWIVWQRRANSVFAADGRVGEERVEGTGRTRREEREEKWRGPLEFRVRV